MIILCWVLPHLNLIILLSINCINGPNSSSLLVSTFFACNCVMPSHSDSGLNSSSALANRVLATKKNNQSLEKCLCVSACCPCPLPSPCDYAQASLIEDERLLAHSDPSHPRWGHLIFLYIYIFFNS